MIHGDATNAGTRVAMCVIGIAEESETTTVASPLTSFALGKKTLTARVSGKRVTSTNGKYSKANAVPQNAVCNYR